MILRALPRDAVVHHLKDDEVADVREQPLRREKAFQQRLHGRRRSRFYVDAIDRFPRRVPLFVRRPHAVQRGDTVRDDSKGVVVEELRDIVPIVLDLVPGAVYGGILGVGIL